LVAILAVQGAFASILKKNIKLNEKTRERERDLRLGLKPNFIYNLIRITPSPDPPFKKGCTFAEQNVNVLFI
jgi:hypothetical protein